VAAPTRDEEAALHPFNRLVLAVPAARAPDDERERRQMRATYYGAMLEVDDQLDRLFAYLDTSGLADSTLVVLTSDHGEMGGDHWLFEKLGYWDESFQVPLIIRDPDRAADAARGRVVDAFTESVDVLPTICAWLGIEVPLQADGFALQPFTTAVGTGDDGLPGHWRTEAHWSWHFSNPATRAAESHFGIPMAHCSLDVARGPAVKYVQFAADSEVLPPLLFDLDADPAQRHDLVAGGGAAEPAWRAAQRLLQWRMRNEDRQLSGTVLTADRGPVAARDRWR
jgi:arylsulfatase A-like enzyme